ncbi:MAG: HlyD family efflux transporter periplasmic adaptor subunit [Pseudomonadota bacterium]
MRFMTRSLIGVFLLALTVGLLTWAGGSFMNALQDRIAREDRGAERRERVLTVGVVRVEPEEVTPIISAYGEVRSRRELEVRASASGTLVFLSPKFVDGGRVEAGELLAQIDPSEATAALAVKEADLTDALADLQDAAQSLELAQDEVDLARNQAVLRRQALVRQQDLKERGVGTDANVEDAELAVAAADQSILSSRQALAQADIRLSQAETRRARAEIDLSEAERLLAETEIRAGFSGTLSETAVAEGGLVTVNERLATLIDPDRLEVAFRLSTAQYTRLLDVRGSLILAPVNLALDVFGTDLTTTARITRESGSVSEGTTGRVLFAEIEAPGGFRPGDFVTVEVREPAMDGVALLPARAVDAAGYALAIGPEDRLVEVATPVVRRQGDFVIIDAEGLENRLLVAERTPLTGAGIRVRAVGADVPDEAEPEPELVELDPERRAKLVAFIEANQRMPADAKERVLSQLQQDRVPAQTVARIEARMGG